MPIIDVEIVCDEDSPDAQIARPLAEAAGAVLKCDPGTVWVRVRWLPPSAYAENGGGPPESVCPAFVRVLLADFPEPRALAKEAIALARALAAVMRRPVENVHVIYEPAGRGRVAFGGRLMA